MTETTHEMDQDDHHLASRLAADLGLKGVIVLAAIAALIGMYLIMSA